MAVCERRTDREVRVEFSGFCFQESDDEYPAELYPEGFEAGGGFFLSPGDHRIDVRSAGHTHYASVAVEVWDGRPPEDGSLRWEARGEERIFCPSGELGICTFDGPAGDPVALGPAGLRWWLRLYCTGRREVARLTDHGVPHGVERFPAQLCPADAGA